MSETIAIDESIERSAFECGASIALYSDPREIERLAERFEDCSLPRTEWTHQAHLSVALWYLIHYPEPEATTRIREGIMRYNAAGGVRMTPEGGYHETMTRFWIRVVRKHISDMGANCSILALANGLADICGDKNLPLAYYSRERLLSWEARTTWVEPDLKPFEQF